jgi:hypothetical protein
MIDLGRVSKETKGPGLPEVQEFPGSIDYREEG